MTTMTETSVHSLANKESQVQDRLCAGIWKVLEIEEDPWILKTAKKLLEGNMRVEAPITGREAINNLSEPRQALAHFYRAFNTRDLQEMSQNWLESDAVTMINPTKGIDHGWEEIVCAYNSVFTLPTKIYMELCSYNIYESSELFYASGVERGFFRRGHYQADLEIRTNRIFKRFRGGWKQVQAHSSIERPDLLKRYRIALLG